MTRPRSRAYVPSTRAKVPYRRGCGVPSSVGSPSDPISVSGWDRTVRTSCSSMRCSTTIVPGSAASTRAAAPVGSVPHAADSSATVRPSHDRSPAHDEMTTSSAATRPNPLVVDPASASTTASSTVEPAVYGYWSQRTSTPSDRAASEEVDGRTDQAAGVATGCLQVRDAHGDAGRSTDGDRLVQRTQQSGTLVTDVRRVHPADPRHLVGKRHELTQGRVSSGFVDRVRSTGRCIRRRVPPPRRRPAPRPARHRAVRSRDP